jgi:hypothetical protein
MLILIFLKGIFVLSSLLCAIISFCLSIFPFKTTIFPVIESVEENITKEGGSDSLLEKITKRGASYIIKVIKSRKMTRAGHVARMAEVSNEEHILVGKPGGNRSLGRSGRR